VFHCETLLDDFTIKNTKETWGFTKCSDRLIFFGVAFDKLWQRQNINSITYYLNTF